MTNSSIPLTQACLLLVATLLSAGGHLTAAEPPDGQRLSEPVTIEFFTVAPPPAWALRQRQVLDAQYPAALEFVNRYTRNDGTIIWRKEWPGMDGSDDGYESFYNFALYYVLGGPAEMYSLSRKLWDGVTRQFTEYGQVHREFDAHYDWMHHGESYTYFYFFGLADPLEAKNRERALRFAAMYIGEDPEAANYDPVRKLIRSPINGSRGPHFVNTAEDWVTHRPILAHYPLPYDDIPHVVSSDAWNDDEKFPLVLEAMNERMMRGDVPLNLTATSLVANAYMVSSTDKYRQWIEEYAQAWIDRVAENGGILPDNVGLDGKIGQYIDGKWWGGYYGWRWPHGLFNQLESTVIGGTNAYLVSGDARFLELPRSVLRLVEKEARSENGQFLVPHRHGDQGWYDYRVLNPKYPVHLWYASRSAEDWKRVERYAQPDDWKRLAYRKGKGDSENLIPWLGYLSGQNPEYPLQILEATYAETLRRLQLIRDDRSTVDQQDVHHWQQRNPVVLEGLVQTMLGAPNHIYHGGLLHASLRYFDPAQRRPGLPPDVAALVQQVTANGVSLQLVNLHPSELRPVILQAGMFGEHTFQRARQVIHYPYQFHTINSHLLQINLGPGAVAQLELNIDRFSRRPSYRFPWN